MLRSMISAELQVNCFISTDTCTDKIIFFKKIRSIFILYFKLVIKTESIFFKFNVIFFLFLGKPYTLVKIKQLKFHKTFNENKE